MASAVCAYSRTTAGSPPISPSGSNAPNCIVYSYDFPGEGPTQFRHGYRLSGKTRRKGLRSGPWNSGPNLHRGSAADHGDHRVADILDPFGKPVRLDPFEPGMMEIALDEMSVAVIVEGAPDRHGLRPEAAVREADDERRAGPQQTRNLA